MTPELEAMVLTIASEYGTKGRRYGADHEDFRQEFMCWLLAHKKGVGQRLEANPEEGLKYVGKSLRNQGKDHLRALRSQSGRSVDDNYRYTRAEVKALLPVMYAPERWYESPRPEGSIPEADWVASLTDVQRAYARLGEEDRDLLAMFHREGWTNKMMAQSADVSEALMSYRHNRALDRLLRLLGGVNRVEPNPWQGRRAVSNAAARAYQRSSYETGESA